MKAKHFLLLALEAQRTLRDMHKKFDRLEKANALHQERQSLSVLR